MLKKTKILRAISDFILWFFHITILIFSGNNKLDFDNGSDVIKVPSLSTVNRVIDLILLFDDVTGIHRSFAQVFVRTVTGVDEMLGAQKTVYISQK